MTHIRAIAYEESRLKFFRELRERKKRGLKFFKRRAKDAGYLSEAYAKCAELGDEISYLDDVIKMLEGYNGRRD